MKTYLISDTHFNHAKIAEYCSRPENFTELLIKRWREVVKPSDVIIHLGDVSFGPVAGWLKVTAQLTGRKILIRGNHDRQNGNQWWMEHGFDFACDGMRFRNCWLSHEPADAMPEGCEVNIHGHLHNIWDGYAPEGRPKFYLIGAPVLKHPWQRLFSVEYTDYRPVEFEKFLAQERKYRTKGPCKAA